MREVQEIVSTLMDTTRDEGSFRSAGLERSISIDPQCRMTFSCLSADVKRFTAETLPELERLLGELSVLSASLRRLTDQTERNPAGLLFGRRPVPEGPGESLTGQKKP